MSGHERERLSAYLDGELPPDERADVLAHLGACPECTAFLAGLAAADQAVAALPAEAPEGYFDTFPARVRARLHPRKPGFAAGRLPVWTWAAAAVLLLAVITPLTLRQVRPNPEDVRSSLPVAPAPVPTRAEPNLAARSRAPEPQPEAPSPTAPRARPTPAVALPPAAQAPAVVPPVEGAPPESKDEAAEAFFAREPAAPPPPERDLARQDAAAEVESETVLGGVVSEESGNREKRARAAPGPAVAAEAASPTLSAARAGHAGLEAHEDAFHRLEAVRPRSAGGWRRLREQWNALAAAEADPVRADEARVRALVAAREAWRAGGEEGDEAVFRAQAESYLRRDDARQRPRVERLLAEP